jgi:hypothetical protein
MTPWAWVNPGPIILELLKPSIQKESEIKEKRGKKDPDLHRDQVEEPLRSSKSLMEFPTLRYTDLRQSRRKDHRKSRKLS